MEIKKMRQVLRDAEQPVPRSNADVMPAYYDYLNSLKGEDAEPQESNVIEGSAHVDAEVPAVSPVVKLVADNIYTYIGSGDEPPHMINFMGLQKFIRGQAVEVTNPVVIGKIGSHRCFVKGKIDQEKLFENDEKEKIRADEQRKTDQQTQAMIDRVNKS